MNPRPLTVTLELYTDGDETILANPDLWRQLLLGQNPSFAVPGDRQPVVRVQDVDVRIPSLGQPKKKKTGKRVTKVSSPRPEPIQIEEPS